MKRSIRVDPRSGEKSVKSQGALFGEAVCVAGCQFVALLLLVLSMPHDLGAVWWIYAMIGVIVGGTILSVARFREWWQHVIAIVGTWASVFVAAAVLFMGSLATVSIVLFVCFAIHSLCQLSLWIAGAFVRLKALEADDQRDSCSRRRVKE